MHKDSPTVLYLPLSYNTPRKLCMDVNPSDSSYMPQRITVQGGVAADHVEDLSTVRPPVLASALVASDRHYQFQSSAGVHSVHVPWGV